MMFTSRVFDRKKGNIIAAQRQFDGLGHFLSTRYNSTIIGVLIHPVMLASKFSFRTEQQGTFLLSTQTIL